MASQDHPDIGSVFAHSGDIIVPSALARGPWNPNAQHGGAPAALLATIAERAMAAEPGWTLVRLTLEFLRPVPIAPLQARHEVQPGGSVRRVALTLMHQDTPVVTGIALFMRERAVELVPTATTGTLPPPDRCTEAIRIPGMVEQTSFHYTAMESRVA